MPILPDGSPGRYVPFVATPPAAPTIGTVTAGNTTASIPFTPPTTGGATISLYTAISSPGGIQTSGISSPLNCTGLTNGVLYTFTMTATNVLGPSVASAPSNAVTPSGSATVPVAPTIGTATAGNSSASITFTPNGNGGSAITGFTATSTPGSITGSGASSPVTVSGLTNGTAYTFTVHATNAIGNSAESGASNSVTPSAGSNLVMYANGVLNALWPAGQDLSYYGTYPPAWSVATAYVVGNLVSVTGSAPSQCYRCIINNTGATFPGADWVAINFPDNYLDTASPQGASTYALALYGIASNPFCGWQQATNWPRPDQGGTNGLDVSAYTQLQFDYKPNTGDGTGIQFHYNRSTGNDLGVSTQFSPATLVNIVGAITANAWNTNLRIPLCHLGSLSSYNSYKFGIQRQNAGVSYFDNVQWIQGGTSWIYRGNATLESGWSDTSSNATITYNYSAQNISASFYSLNNPGVPMANFTGTMTAGGSLTVSGVTNAIQIGMWVFGASVPNTGGVSTCQITGGSGTSWTVSGGANIAAASMTCGFLQTQVGIVRWVPAGTSSFWQRQFSGGFNTTAFPNYTVSLLPTQSGYTYTCQAVNTSGVLIGNSVNMASFTPADNGVSTSHWTVYSIPTASMGVSNTTIGGIRITDTSGHTATIYACQDGFWS
jgi:trimeric autotransporter adhesin